MYASSDSNENFLVKQKDDSKIKQLTITSTAPEFVEKIITQCMQLVFSQQETINTLHYNYAVHPNLTIKVWETMEMENPEYFYMYNKAVRLKQQIMEFNSVVEVAAKHHEQVSNIAMYTCHPVNYTTNNNNSQTSLRASTIPILPKNANSPSMQAQFAKRAPNQLQMLSPAMAPQIALSSPCSLSALSPIAPHIQHTSHSSPIMAPHSPMGLPFVYRQNSKYNVYPSRRKFTTIPMDNVRPKYFPKVITEAAQPYSVYSRPRYSYQPQPAYRVEKQISRPRSIGYSPVYTEHPHAHVYEQNGYPYQGDAQYQLSKLDLQLNQMDEINDVIDDVATQPQNGKALHTIAT